MSDEVSLADRYYARTNDYSEVSLTAFGARFQLWWVTAGG